MGDYSERPIAPISGPQAASIKSQMSRAAQGLASQVAAKEAFTESVEESFNPFAADRVIQFRALRDRRRTREEVKSHRMPEPGKVLALTEASETADRYQERNPEADAQKLRDLRQRLIETTPETPEALLDVVMEVFDDPSLADEALDYLLETTSGDLNERVAAAKNLLFTRMGRQVRAGRNIGSESREFASMGLGTAQDLRELYRDVTGNPRESNQLFIELSSKYRFEQLEDIVDFLLQSLGADLRSKGPSIARGELYRLITETRVLQSILGIYIFFQTRMRLIRKMYKKHNLTLPEELDFEELAKEFIDLVEEKYPTAAKLFSAAHDLEISQSTIGQIIVLQQFRDAVREVAPRIYRTLQHRYDLLMAIVEALEQLEGQLEEEEEQKAAEEEGDGGI